MADTLSTRSQTRHTLSSCLGVGGRLLVCRDVIANARHFGTTTPTAEKECAKAIPVETHRWTLPHVGGLQTSGFPTPSFP